MISGAGSPEFRRAAGATAGGEAASAGGLRLAVALPGGIAPGTFEAGATCGLLAWIQEVNAVEPGSVLIDVITGASAGALTGLLAARVLLGGDDPIAVYRQAWVSAPSLRSLRAAGSSAPLSLRPARAVAHRLLFAPAEPLARWRQPSPVALDVALGCLRGFSRAIPSQTGVPDGEQPLIAATYVDWGSFELDAVPADSDAVAKQWSNAIDSAIASASHPLAFRARRLDRETHRSKYVRNGVVNLPADRGDLELWYTDGGVFDNEPLGRCVHRVVERDEASSQSRLVILVRSGGRWPPPADNPAWSGHGRPRWLHTLARALDLIASNATGHDLIQVEQTNARLRWSREVAVKIAELLDENEETHAELRHLLALIEKDPVPSAGVDRRPVPPADAADASLAELVERVVRSACGLVGKEPIEVAVVGAERDLTGPQALGSVVGFLEPRQREDHFAAGYSTMLGWIEQAPELASRVRPELIGRGVSAARPKVRGPGAPRLARRRSSNLSFAVRAELLRLGSRTVKIAVADIEALVYRREMTRVQARIRRRRIR